MQISNLGNINKESNYVPQVNNNNKKIVSIFKQGF